MDERCATDAIYFRQRLKRTLPLPRRRYSHRFFYLLIIINIIAPNALFVCLCVLKCIWRFHVLEYSLRIMKRQPNSHGLCGLFVDPSYYTSRISHALQTLSPSFFPSNINIIPNNGNCVRARTERFRMLCVWVKKEQFVFRIESNYCEWKPIVRRENEMAFFTDFILSSFANLEWSRLDCIVCIGVVVVIVRCDCRSVYAYGKTTKADAEYRQILAARIISRASQSVSQSSRVENGIIISIFSFDFSRNYQDAELGRCRRAVPLVPLSIGIGLR